MVVVGGGGVVAVLFFDDVLKDFTFMVGGVGGIVSVVALVGVVTGGATTFLGAFWGEVNVPMIVVPSVVNPVVSPVVPSVVPSAVVVEGTEGKRYDGSS